MKYQLVVHPKAEDDLRNTFEWYEEQEKGLGGEFLRCVEAAISHINRSPKMFFLIYKGIRRSLIRRFPYGIFYSVGNYINFLTAENSYTAKKT